MKYILAGRIMDGDPTQHDWESVAVRWFPLDALPWQLFAFSREQIEDACTHAASPVKKEQRLPVTQLLLLNCFMVYRRIRNKLRARTHTGPNRESEDR